MNKIRVIARLDINNEYVIKGKYLEGLRKVGKPNELANKYYHDGVDEIIFLDAVASLYDRNSLIDIIRLACMEIFVPITVGGGIRTLDDIQNALHAGADKVAINSQAVRDLNFIREAVEAFGSQAIVGSVVGSRHRNRWEAFMDNAKHRTHNNAVDWAKVLEENGVGEIVVNSIDRDGIEKGFEIELIRQISEIVNIPVIAASGAGNSQHIVEVCNKAQCDAVAVGSILHYGRESVHEIKKTMKESGIEVRI
jgi:imidazole glycerol-phosphate synthase subunit HisF